MDKKSGFPALFVSLFFFTVLTSITAFATPVTATGWFDGLGKTAKGHGWFYDPADPFGFSEVDISIQTSSDIYLGGQVLSVIKIKAGLARPDVNKALSLPAPEYTSTGACAKYCYGFSFKIPAQYWTSQEYFLSPKGRTAGGILTPLNAGMTSFSLGKAGAYSYLCFNYAEINYDIARFSIVVNQNGSTLTKDGEVDPFSATFLRTDSVIFGGSRVYATPLAYVKESNGQTSVYSGYWVLSNPGYKGYADATLGIVYYQNSTVAFDRNYSCHRYF